MQLNEIYRRLQPSPYGIALLVLCTYVGMSEGFDVQAMAVAAPLISKAWSLSHGALGILLSASVAGQALGSFLLTPIGDRWGRRPAILMGLSVAAAATGMGAVAPDYASMIASRFVAGLALGLALSNTTAIAMEFMPLRWRTIAVVIVCCGYPLGAATGGIIVGRLLPVYGFRAPFYVGGAGTLIALLLCAALLPESPVMLIRRPGGETHLKRLLARLGYRVPSDVPIVAQDEVLTTSTVGALLLPERRGATLLLWVLNFATLALVYFFVMWLPSLFVSKGMSPRDALVATSAFNASGIIGGLTMAILLPPLGAVRTLGGCYATAIAGVLLFSTLHSTDVLFYALLALCGATIVGSQFSLIAVVSQFYPAEIRATGSGYATGAGRCGAILAPIVGGVVLANVRSPASAFALGSIPAAVSLLAIVALGRSFAWRDRAAPTAATN